MATRPLRLNDQGYSDWLTIEQASDLFSGKWQPDTPLKLGAFIGGQATDFLWASLTPLVCISQRVVDLLQENGVTGWVTYPVV